MSSKWTQNGAGAARKIWEAFGEGTTRRTPVQKWFRTFQGGDESIEDTNSCIAYPKSLGKFVKRLA